MADETSTETTETTETAAQEPATGAAEATDPPDLPEGAKQALAAARKDAREAEKARKAAEKSAETAVETARAEMATAIGKALGLSGDETPDPAKLAEQLTASQAVAQQTALELAVYRASAGTADPAALLDSRSFLAKLGDVDPTDAAAVAAAVSEAVAANPAFGLAPGKRVPAPNPALGSSASGAPDLEAQIAAAKKANNIPLVIALENQKLVAPRQ